MALLADETQQASLQSETAALGSQVAQLTEQLKTFNRNEMRIAALQREVEISTASYRKYAESQEQARIDQALQNQRITNIAVFQPATLEIKPTNPRIAWNLLFGWIAATAGGIAVGMAGGFGRRAPEMAAEPDGRLDLPVRPPLPHWTAKEAVTSGSS